MIKSLQMGNNTNVEEVGVKSHSLIRLIKNGLPVPPGIVLTTDFFKSWIDEIKSSYSWTQLAKSNIEDWHDICLDLENSSKLIEINSEQELVLRDIKDYFLNFDDDILFAVRSSSPDENLASASFAGTYATRLCVPYSDLEKAIRDVFSSLFNEQLMTYKKVHQLDVFSPRFAVLIQEQIHSEISGVCFSINPMTNDYDEVLIESSWGLGSSVMSGYVEPDRFTVNKISQRILERNNGGKKHSFWVNPRGGTTKRKGYRENKITLNDEMICELTNLTYKIESIFGVPINIEFAYSNKQLSLLQVNPITSYFPLPFEMITQPGSPRYLYMDVALSQGITINAPISPMGLSWMEYGWLSLIEPKTGIQIKLETPPEQAFIFSSGGRLYANLTNIMPYISLRTFGNIYSTSDIILSKILNDLDSKLYKPPSDIVQTAKITFRLLLVLWRLRRIFFKIIRMSLSPRSEYQKLQCKVESFLMDTTEEVDYTLPLKEFITTYQTPLISVSDASLSALIVFTLSLKALELLVNGKLDEKKEILNTLDSGFPNNIVVQMGIDLSELSKLLSQLEIRNIDQIVERINKRTMPQVFMKKWEAFINKYGFRGPMEMDIARSHYGDDARIFLEQLTCAEHADELRIIHENQINKRKETMKKVLEKSGWFKRLLLNRFFQIIECYGGTRDLPKHIISSLNYAARKRIQMEGCQLHEKGYLDSDNDIFDLTLNDLEKFSSNSSLDLRLIRTQRVNYLAQFSTQIHNYPRVIDSRGRILGRENPAYYSGDFKGLSVSPGVVEGVVRIIRDPVKDKIRGGEILVAYTMDPGWMPQILNSSAILLEVGGLLHHGAVIAREFGKPCIVGIDQLTKNLKDGQRILVDGDVGNVCILS